MKLRFLLLFLVVVGFGVWGSAQETKPYTHLIITEAQFSMTEHSYMEITNMGSETVDLGNFEFGSVGPWSGGNLTQPYPQANFIMLPAGKMLAPGKSYLMAVACDYQPKLYKKDPSKYRERVTVKDFYNVIGSKVYTIADNLLHIAEAGTPIKADSVSPNAHVLGTWGGWDTYFLRHHYINPATSKKDSTVIDQVGGTFTQSDGANPAQAKDVAGVKGATFSCVLIRRNSVTTGNLNFNTGRGTDLVDSEWIPVPVLGGYDYWNVAPWRAAFWTAGNQVNAILDKNTLVSKTGKVLVDLDNFTITVPWGVRRDDSIMHQFKKTPGLAWGYDFALNSADSSYLTAQTGDILKLYVCGDVAKIQDFKIVALAPTASDNIVIPKMAFDYSHRRNYVHPTAFGGMRVTDGVSVIDSITNMGFATRVDSLFKYLEKAPKASWKIVYKSGVAQPDLKTGDILRVTSENNKVKDYFVKLERFYPASNSLLSAITWPDIPESFKGAIASTYGWKGDTIPGFSPSNKNYVVQIPLDYNGIPALVFTKQQLDSKVVVSRLKSLSGSIADRTVTFTVAAENDTVISVYSVLFNKEKDQTNVQPYIGEPFFSQMVFRVDWSTTLIEIANPGTQIIDLSNYMITSNYASESPGFYWNNAPGEWAKRFTKYIPGKKWQDEANWAVKPRVVIPDIAVNPMVYPGEVFVMANMTNCNGAITPDRFPYNGQIDVNFGTTNPNFPKLDNPWHELIPDNLLSIWCNSGIFLYKIMNDSVKDGSKAATDRKDFKLIESFGGLDGNDWKPDGWGAGSQQVGYTRNSNIYKGNPKPNGSFGDTPATSEWTHQRSSDYGSLNLGWPWQDYAVATGIGSITLDDITMYRSTVTSKFYKVSPGYGKKETIRGLTTGTTVTEFYQNLIKANELQEFKVKSVATDLELAAGIAIANGDSLIVLSKDSTNTTKYILEVTVGGLSHNAVLTSTPYTVDVKATTGTIAGFDKNTLLKTVVAGVVVPAGAEFTVTDANDAYMSLLKVNYDSAYVNVVATDKVFFEVIAEDGITKIVYQLKPTVLASDAYVTSDVYSVDQHGSLIQFVPGGTTVHTLLGNLTPATGATMAIFDKAGFQRTEGSVYRDDKVLVTAADGKTTKIYYLSMLNFYANTYMAFVTSDVYKVEQLTYIITGPSLSSAISDFKANLYPSFGATLKVIDKNGNENTGSTFVSGDKLLVTAFDGTTTATYLIENVTGITPVAVTSNIKMYPNPTTGKVIVQGLTQGNRVRVFNSAGITLRDVIVENSTDYVSLEAQPAGIYIFVISSGTQNINIQKIIKK